MMGKRWGIVSCLLLLDCALIARAADVRSELRDYVAKQDGAFSWKQVSTKSLGRLASIHTLTLTSQVWKETTWEHNLLLIEPVGVPSSDAVLLFITGGQTGDDPRKGDLAAGLALAKLCRARVAVLPQVPNQPLLEGKKEDALIAETFVRYLESRDAEWPLLFPMVKSAVKAMDAVQEFSKEQGKPAARFVVTGASKRGWTTWLTGASDPRVKAIAPMVIPTLNIEAQNQHQLENFDGKFSEQIRDYTNRGLIGEKSKPGSAELMAMVDPFTYRTHLALPKLQINGTNDPYWTLDSMNLYWDELVGPKWVVYLPNAGHGLESHREFALNGIAALFRHVVNDLPFPQLSWKHDDHEGKLRLVIQSNPAPKSLRVWTATSPNLDFRKSEWTSESLAAESSTTIEKDQPATGNIAFFADLEYEIDGLPYHLSTQIRQTERRPTNEVGN